MVVALDDFPNIGTEHDAFGTGDHGLDNDLNGGFNSDSPGVWSGPRLSAGRGVYHIVDDADPYGVGSSGLAVQAGSGLTAPGLAKNKSPLAVSRPINPDIVLLQEVRDYDVCVHLGEAIAPGIYHVAICSAFKEPFQRGLGKQQVAILSKYQAQAAWAEPWKSMNGVDPPRGFAFAWFKIGNEDIGVYSLHLKSNLITHGDKETETAKNIRKREVAVTQLVAHVHDVIETTMLAIKGIVIGGDFNTNHDQEMFAAEKTLDSLIGAGYESGFEELPLERRVTHPSNHGFPDATFDYLIYEGLESVAADCHSD